MTTNRILKDAFIAEGCHHLWKIFVDETIDHRDENDEPYIDINNSNEKTVDHKKQRVKLIVNEIENCLRINSTNNIGRQETSELLMQDCGESLGSYYIQNKLDILGKNDLKVVVKKLKQEKENLEDHIEELDQKNSFCSSDVIEKTPWVYNKYVCKLLRTRVNFQDRSDILSKFTKNLKDSIDSTDSEAEEAIRNQLNRTNEEDIMQLKNNRNGIDEALELESKESENKDEENVSEIAEKIVESSKNRLESLDPHDIVLDGNKLDNSINAEKIQMARSYIQNKQSNIKSALKKDLERYDGDLNQYRKDIKKLLEDFFSANRKSDMTKIHSAWRGVNLMMVGYLASINAHFLIPALILYGIFEASKYLVAL